MHGTPSWSYLWRGVAPALAERFSVYLLDLAGYGDSGRHEGQDMSVAAQSRVLARLLDLWGLERPALVGHDIGGAIVLRTHLLEHRPAGRIALVDAAFFRPWNTPATRHMRAHLDAYRTMPSHLYERIVESHIATAVVRPLAPEALDAYLRPWRGPAGQAAYFRKIEQWRDEHLAEVEPLLGSIAEPVLVLWGEEDAWLHPGLAQRFAREIPGARAVVLPGAGHFAPEDVPEAVVRELEAFLLG